MNAVDLFLGHVRGLVGGIRLVARDVARLALLAGEVEMSELRSVDARRECLRRVRQTSEPAEGVLQRLEQVACPSATVLCS